MVTQGAKVIIAVAEDGDALATAVDEAAKKGVKVISYDRLIKSPKIAAYVSFDNVDVGRNQAKGVLAKVKNRATSSSWAAARPTTTPTCSARARWKSWIPSSSPARSRSWPTSGSRTGIPPTPRSSWRTS